MFASSTSWIETLNRWGESHVAFASAMFVQSAVLIAVLAGLDVLLLRRTRAVVRYGVWSLLLIKLLLPPSLASPVSLGRWLPAMTVATPSAVRHELVDRQALSMEPPVDLADSTRVFHPAERPTGETLSANAVATAPSDQLNEPVASSSSVFEVAPAHRASPRLNWQALLLLLWAGGVSTLTGIAVRHSMHVRRIVRRSVSAPPELQSLFLKSAESAGVSASSLQLRISDDLGSPAICGFWTGTVLLPRAVLSSLDREQLRFVLVHELVHWRRWDLQVNLLQTLLQIAYFYNPVVWIGNAVLRRLREQAVDEAVLVALASSPGPYGDTLLKVATAIRAPLGLAVRSIGVVESGAALSGRIRRMLIRPVPRTARLGVVGLAVVLVTGMTLLPMAQREHSPVAAHASIEPIDQPLAPPPVIDDVQLAQTRPVEATESSLPSDAPQKSPENSDPPDPQQIVARLSERSQLWIRTPTIRLRTLQYTYELGGDAHEVELVRENWTGPIGQWFGATLSTGLHHLLQFPDACDVRAERIAAEGEKAEVIRLTVTSKAVRPRMSLAIGNGIANSWRGYFEHGSDEMTLDVDPGRMVPLRESHRIKDNPQITEITYGRYEEVEPGQWIPRQVDVVHDVLVYRMSFAWQQDSVWLLTQTEVNKPGGSSVVARVGNVRVNDEHFLEQKIARQQRRSEAFAVLTDMLDRNQPWLSPDYSDEKSLQYTFHALSVNVTETCQVYPDRRVVFKVVHNAQWPLGDNTGQTKTVLPSGEISTVNREWKESKFGLRGERTPSGTELRHYGRIGCRFDLPLFRLGDLIDRANIDVRDGEWNGIPCHVATVRGLGPDVNLACGTALAFTSWSFLHHLRPATETIYIDKERMVPIHETFVSDLLEQCFEIDFGDYRELITQQWAPLSIRIEGKDRIKFTCDYKFQIVGDTHWLLQEVESGGRDNKSRGVVLDVGFNPPLPVDVEAE